MRGQRLVFALSGIALGAGGMACSSKSVNEGSSGGSGGTSGSGAAGGATAGCVESSGGLLGPDGQFESGKGLWYGSLGTAVSPDAACGKQSLEFSADGFSEIRHEFLPATTGPYVLSFCAKAVGGNVSLLVNYMGPSTNDFAQVVLTDTPVGTTEWHHLVSNPMDVTKVGPHAIAITMGGPSSKVLIDCASID